MAPPPLLPRAPNPQQILLQVVGVAATSHWLLFAIQLAPNFEHSALAAALSDQTAQPSSNLAGALLTGALLAGVFEELLFRGVAIAVLLPFRGMAFAIVASALLFGAAHLDAHHAAVATLLGLQLGLLRVVHGLSLAVAAHVANNALVILAALPGSLNLLPFSSPGTTTRPALLVIALGLTCISCAALLQSARSPEPGLPPAASDL
jgi:membrane protease YdiL (CAAX protease family)